MRLIYLWTSRLILTISLVGILPVSTQSAIVQAQSKKKNPAQASKYAKRANTKAKKKDYRGALSDYKRAYKLNPTSNYKKRVQQLTSLAKKQSGSNKSSKRPSKKQIAQASAYSKRGNSKAKKKNYAGALKDFQKAYQLNSSSSNKKKIQQLQSILRNVSGSIFVPQKGTKAEKALSQRP